MASADRQMDAMQRGRAAFAVKQHSQKMLEAEKERILSQLYGSYTGNKLTTETLWGKVGELFALRNFSAKLESEIQQGRLAEDEQDGR